LAIASVLLACAAAAHAQTSAAQTNGATTTNVVTTTNGATVTTTITITTTTIRTNAIPLANAGATTNATVTTNALAKAGANTNAAPMPAKAATPTNGWQTTIAVGVSIARGNTDNTLASITAMTEKKWLKNDLLFGGDGRYGETRTPNTPKETENAETLHGFSQYNRMLGSGFYDYLRADGFHDGIADIKYRLTLSPGIGYYFVTNKTWDFCAEAGPGYIKEQLDGRSENFSIMRMAEKAHYNISPIAKAWETVELLPQLDRFDNYVINFEAGIDAALTKDKKLSLRTVLKDSYNNEPAAGRLKNDLQIITGLAFKF
jgi:putative salt-induced outer membrane protein YdiY